MSSESSSTIAIIGAGISGLALALTLHYINTTQTSKITIYESRPSPLNIGGAVMLSPNALRILDTLGLYDLVRAQGYNFTDLEFRHPAPTGLGEIIDVYDFGSKSKHGYDANRIYRSELISILLDRVRAIGITIEWNRKLSTITYEDAATGVHFAFADGHETRADLLIGADGIHSTVRKHMYPTAAHAPRFVHLAGITASVPASNLPPDTKLTQPITIMSSSHGAFVLAPQTRSGAELLIGKQLRVDTTPSRTDWDTMQTSPSTTHFLQSSNEVFGSIAVAAAAHIDPLHVNVWPFYVVPTLPRWLNETANVVLVGDAAHAIPPSAGQGISQALEDVFMLAMLLARGPERKVALRFWQAFRQDRVDRVLEVNARVDARRVPRKNAEEEEKEKEKEREIEKEEWDLDWLYGIDIEKVVDEWVAEQQQ